MSQTKVKSGLLNFPDQTDFVKLPSGTTAQRPSSPEKGYSRYNTTDDKLEYWNGTEWQQLPGVIPPTITSVSYPGDDLAADPAGGQTITLTGNNFLNGASIEIDGTTASVVTVVSGTEITFTAPAKAAGDYDIVLTNGDNTTATYVDGITYNGLPSWTTPAGNLGTFPAGSTIPTITLVATEPDSGVVSYSVTTGALPTGLALTGADIDGTVPSPAGQTTYNFSVTASDDENQESTERAFNIVVYIQVTNTVSEVDPFGDSSGVVLYKLDGDATDEGGVYDGTWGGTESYTTGMFGQAGVFNGTSSFINIQDPTANITTANYSISLWVKTTTSSVSYLISKYLVDGNGATDIFRFTVGSDGIVSFRVDGVSNTDKTVNSTSTINNGSWHHLVGVVETNNIIIYVDGLQESNESGTFASPSSVTRNVFIGKHEGNDSYFDGSIDQVRIFNKAITPLEIESLYRERTVVCGGQADTLDILGDNSCIATYQLNGNANDLSGNYSGTPTDVSYGVGEFDLAGVFNGSSSFIDTGISTLSSPFSVSMWINENILASGGFFGNWNGTANDDMFWTTTSDGRLRINIDVTSNQYFGVAGDVSVNTWHHVVVSFNNGVYEVYLDSQSKGNATTANTSFSSGANFFIGKHEGNDSYFDGSIDQVRIFNKALDQDDVNILFAESACDALACSGTTNTLNILGNGDTSCIATYPLDGSPADLSGNYNGVQTDVTYPVGKYDLAAAFNGSTSYITLPVTQSNDISISAWIKIEDLTRQHQIVSYDSTPRCLQFRVESDQTVSAYWFSGTKAQSTSSVSQGVWAHVVATWEDNGTQKIYFNGVMEDSNAATTRPNFPNLYVGKRSISGGTVDDFLGQIDQVRIFNKALSLAEVGILYNNETACN